MSKCKLNGVDFIHSVFSPSIAVLASQDAETLCQQNNLTLVELLKPFARLSQDVYVKDTSNISHVVRGLEVIFQDMNCVLPSATYVKKLLSDVVMNCHMDSGSSLVSVGTYDIQVPNSTSWFEVYRDVFLATMPPSDHELVKHCLGVLLVVSTSHPDPLDQLAKLTQQQNYQQHQQTSKPPRWFSANILKFYLLINDLSSGDQSKAEATYQSMKSTYGAAHCHMLQINSRPASQLSSAAELPDPWLQYLLPMGQVDSTTPPQQHANDELIQGKSHSFLPFPASEAEDPFPSGPDMSHPLAGSPSIPEALVQSSGGDMLTSNMRVSASLPHLSGAQHNGMLMGTTIASGTGRLPFSKESRNLPHGQRLTVADQERVRAFVHEFVVKALIPWVEKTMKSLNDQIASKLRSTRSLISATRKFFSGGGGSGGSGNRASPSQASGSIQGGVQGANGAGGPVLSGSGGLSNSLTNLTAAGSTSVVFTQDAPELQMRRYADLAFLFQQYEVAHQTYNVLKKDFQHDSAWMHVAGAMEMSALSVYIQGAASQRQYPHHYMETAISNYLTVCRNIPFATRATFLNAEALKSRGMLSEASVHFIKLTTESAESLDKRYGGDKDNDLRSALLLEQAAHCYVNMRVPMVRKYAFHMVLAGHRFSKAAQRKHAIRCYTQALQVYKGRDWGLAEDHINFTIGRHAFYLRQLDSSAAALKHLLSKESQQTPTQQAIFLREFIFVFKQHLISLIGGEKTLLDGAFPQLPLPMVTPNQVKVMMGRPVRQIEANDDSEQISTDISVEARGVQFSDTDLSGGSWAKLEEVLVASITNDGFMPINYKTTLPCLTRDTINTHQPKTPIAEPVTVQIPLENPVQVPLVLTELYLLWQFIPSPSFPSASSGPTGGPAAPVGGSSSLGNAADSTGLCQSPRVVTNEMERDRLHQAKELVTTEVLPDFYLLPGERKPVELSVIPKQLGRLIIIGMAFNLGTASPNQNQSNAFSSLSSADLSGAQIKPISGGDLFIAAQTGTPVSVKGKLPLEVQGRIDPTERGERTSYTTDHRLDLTVTPSMPLLRVVFSEFPSALVCGEVRRITIQVSNMGQQPLTRLRLSTTQPGFLTFGFDEFAHTFESDVYQTVQPNTTSTTASNDEFVSPDLNQTQWTEIPLVSPGTLAPGATVNLPCWIRGGDTPVKQLPIDMLFYYQSTEANSHYKKPVDASIGHRVLRHRSLVDMLPSLKLRGHAQQSRGTSTANILVSLQVENSASHAQVKDQLSTEFSVLQVSGASKHWTINQLATNKSSDIRIQPGETICLCLRAAPSSRPAPGHTLFSNVPFDSTRTLHAAGTPSADFYYRCCSLTPPSANGASDGGMEAAVRVQLTLIVFWKMNRVHSDASVVTAVGQSHVTIPVLDEWVHQPVEYLPTIDRHPSPVRFVPSPEADPSVQLQPVIMQSKMVRVSLHHPQHLFHNFSRKSFVLVHVDVQLYNAGESDLLVRLEPELDSSSNLHTTNPKPASSSVSTQLNWIGLTSQQTQLAPHQSRALTIRACMSRPGLYEVHRLAVKAALLQNNKDWSSGQPGDLVFVRQNNAFSSFIVIDQASE